MASDFRLHSQPVPHRVPHFARRVLNLSVRNHNQHAPALANCTFYSSIDLEKQNAIEEGVNAYIEKKSDYGIQNACVVLVYAPTREVVAYLGSAKFSDKTIHGQVDGITAPRSPGSLLKPYIYGLALDQGLIHPSTLLADSPKNFGDYRPENFEREFMGPVTATDALARSRNIPAVDLMRKLKAPDLYHILVKSGVQLKPKNHYGLSLALGGLGLTVEDAARLYCSLGHDGFAKSLDFGNIGLINNQTSSKLDQAELLTEASRFLVLDMLSSDSQQEHLAIHKTDTKVSWKTGTSHGFRDAWCAGVNGDYVMVVWLGNFDGKANHELIARQSAAPLFFELLARLQLPASNSKTIPATVKKIELCATSGMLPLPHCPHHKDGWFIPGISSIQACSLHRKIFVDSSTGKRIAFPDGRANIVEEVAEFWPPEMHELFRLAGLPRKLPPPYDENSIGIGADTGSPPNIISPIANRIYLIDDHSNSKLPLRAEASAGVRRLYWFIDDNIVGSCLSSELLLWNGQVGKHRLVVIDDDGRSQSAEFTVRNRSSSFINDNNK